MKNLLKKSFLLFSAFLLIGCSQKDVEPDQETSSTEKETVENSEENLPEDERIMTIKKYYQHITDGELKEAHDMYEIKKVGFQTFTEWYGNTHSANPVGINLEDEDIYKILVHFQEKGGEVQSFEVLMKVGAGKINTLSSKEIINKYEAQFNETLSAKIIQKQGINSVILIKEGKEIILNESNALWFNEDGSLKDRTEIYTEPKFSSTGRYLSYETEMWEWAEVTFYDTKTEQEVKTLPGLDKFFYIKNDSQLLACSSNYLMGTHHAFIYDLPSLEITHIIYNGNSYDGELKTWVNPEKFMTDVSCEFDQKNQKASVNLKHYSYEDASEASDTIEYEFDTGVERKL
jgi:hypothetical protein